MGEALSLLKDGTHGTHLDVQNGVYLLSAKNIKNGEIHINNEDRQISFLDYQKIHSNFSLQKGDVLLTIVGTIGETAILEEPSNITFQRSVAYLRPEKVTSNFLTSLIASDYFQKNLKNKQTVSAQAGIYLGDLSEIEIKYPDLTEQIAIGNFFKQLDETITLHQRQTEKYQKLKIGFLESVFCTNLSTNSSKKTNDWEQRKLGDCIEDYIEKTTIQNQYPVLTSSQKQGIVFQEDYFADRQVTTDNNIGYFILPRGYFTYRSRSDNGIFKFNRNDLIDKGIISYFYPVFRIQNNDSNFFLYLLNSTIDAQLSLKAEGTGQKVLSLKKFKNVEVTIPSLVEQTAIGNFFKQLDETIALHQRQVEKYRLIKKLFLEKMFIK